MALIRIEEASLLKHRLNHIKDTIEYCIIERDKIQDLFEEMIHEFLQRRINISPIFKEVQDIKAFKKKDSEDIDYLSLVDSFENELIRYNEEYNIHMSPSYIIGMDSLFVSKNVLKG